MFTVIATSHCNSNTLRPRQNGCHFPIDIFKCIFLNQNVWISIQISLKFVPNGSISNIPALVQIMTWCRPGDKPSSEPMMVSLLTHNELTSCVQTRNESNAGVFILKITVDLCLILMTALCITEGLSMFRTIFNVRSKRRLPSLIKTLAHWGRVTHICVSKWMIYWQSAAGTSKSSCFSSISR